MTLDPRVRGNDEQKSTWLEPSRLRVTPLRKCLKRIIDYRGKTPKKLGSDWADKGYRALSAINVKDSGLTSTETIRCVDAETYKKWMKEEVKRGDILLTSEAPAGEVMIWDSDEKIVLSQRLFCLRTNKQFDNRFIKYYLQSPAGKREVNRTRSGSTVAGISAEMFDQIQVLHPETGTPQKNASVLTALDAKIDLNKRINAELEALAKTIYDYWFVQFDFPDAHGRPYKSSGGKMVWNDILKREIPAGWAVGSLDDLGQIVGGSTPSTANRDHFGKDMIPWITPKDLSNNKGNKFIARGETVVSDQGRRSASLTLYPAGTVLMSSRAPVGYLAIALNSVTTNQGFKSFVPSKGYGTSFVYYTVERSMPTIIQYASGSTFIEISGGVLKSVYAVLPEKSTSDAFCDQIEPLVQRQQQAELENIELTQLRDWLLPLLMNGQVRVA
jgi:type I restriction enzyme S subunit